MLQFILTENGTKSSGYSAHTSHEDRAHGCQTLRYFKCKHISLQRLTPRFLFFCSLGKAIILSQENVQSLGYLIVHLYPEKQNKSIRSTHTHTHTKLSKKCSSFCQLSKIAAHSFIKVIVLKTEKCLTKNKTKTLTSHAHKNKSSACSHLAQIVF